MTLGWPNTEIQKCGHFQNVLRLLNPKKMFIDYHQSGSFKVKFICMWPTYVLKWASQPCSTYMNLWGSSFFGDVEATTTTIKHKARQPVGCRGNLNSHIWPSASLITRFLVKFGIVLRPYRRGRRRSRPSPPVGGSTRTPRGCAGWTSPLRPARADTHKQIRQLKLQLYTNRSLRLRDREGGSKLAAN